MRVEVNGIGLEVQVGGEGPAVLLPSQRPQVSSV